MCRKSKRSDQSVGEKEGGRASSMLKARSQAQQTSWFDPCDSCRAAVRPPADVPASRLHAQTLPSMGVHCNGHHGNSRKPVHQPSLRHEDALQSGQSKTRKRPGSGRVAAENFISPARFPRYWPSGGTTKPVLAHLGRKPSAKPDAAKLELQAQPSPAPPVPGRSPGEFQGTKAL